VRPTEAVLNQVEGLIETGQPPAHNLDECDKFYREIHTLYSYLIEQQAHFKIFFAKRLIEVLNDRQVDLKKYGSESKLQAYIYSTWPTEARQYEKIGEYQKLMVQIMKDYQTLISAFKEEKGMSNPKQN
jgi:hypothetical protein